MLVVILLIGLMTSILIPALSSASDVRRAREGARVLSTMLANAQMQAQVSGRAAAVWIQRQKSSSGQAINSAASMDIFLAEVPPPYVGGSLNSTAIVQSSSVIFNDANIGNANIQAGDLIRFSYRGELYQITSITGPSATIAPLDPTQTYPLSGPSGLPFQIYRRPIKSTASAVQLTDGVAIDLNFSGIDFASSGSTFNTSFAPASSTSDIGQIIITFSSTGALDLVYIVPSSGSAQVVRPISGVYLLVGKYEKNSDASKHQHHDAESVSGQLAGLRLPLGGGRTAIGVDHGGRSRFGRLGRHAERDFQRAARAQQSELGGN